MPFTPCHSRLDLTEEIVAVEFTDVVPQHWRYRVIPEQSSEGEAVCVGIVACAAAPLYDEEGGVLELVNMEVLQRAAKSLLDVQTQSKMFVLWHSRDHLFHCPWDAILAGIREAESHDSGRFV